MVPDTCSTKGQQIYFLFPHHSQSVYITEYPVLERANKVQFLSERCSQASNPEPWYLLTPVSNQSQVVCFHPLWSPCGMTFRWSWEMKTSEVTRIFCSDRRLPRCIVPAAPVSCIKLLNPETIEYFWPPKHILVSIIYAIWGHLFPNVSILTLA